MARVSALLRFEKTPPENCSRLFESKILLHNLCSLTTMPVSIKPSFFSICHPELAPEICLPLPHCFAATSEGSAPLLFRAAHGAYPICTHLALICGRVSIAIVWQSRRFWQSWQYNKFTLWLTCGTHPYPLPIHPKSSHFGVTSSQELPGKSSQPDRF